VHSIDSIDVLVSNIDKL